MIENSPPNLIELLDEHGWISLFHEPDETEHEAPATFEETLDWLKQMRDRFQAAYDEG